ncbi:MAG: 4-(cytidine 5'-diphospho)-2-C-methyl-D-erythritol kinase [Bacteroidetes bacterium]|nr:4-(cytidine 5'-diphospho)-2-C-methyl-D-erythritol kinase [Bacteroidota bacterium]
MVCFPNAKINIGLNVIKKRSDGYHDLESVFYPIALCDILEVIENPRASEPVEFYSTGISIPGSVNDNLCIRAYNMIVKDYQLPKVKIHLHKIIPIGAGLGGGSSDAAFFIKLLDEKFELGLSWGEQHNYARQLGSDCSFFVINKPVFAEEKGDKYERIELDLNGYYLVLVYPNIHVNTANAYAGLVPKKPVSSLENDVLKLPVAKWKSVVKNDFEESVFAKYPVVKNLKQSLYRHGAVYASMSGSGSALYGLFEKAVDLGNEFKDCFVWMEKVSGSKFQVPG